MIPVAKPDLSGNEEKYVADAVRSTWISSTGSYIDRFEKEFAEFCNAEESIAVCNGTAALHVVLMALGCGPGDEVIVPSLTYVATANAVRYVGAEPVFVDVDEETWTLDPEHLEDAITRKTKGIISVDLYGHPADADAINHIAGVHGLWVIEDAAEAHGATYKGRPTGSLADIATFSFYGNKIFTCGEGGAVTTSNEQLAKRVRTLKGQGVDPSRRYFFPVTGYNFRLTNVAAAMLCAQLERKEEIVRQRGEVYSLYHEHLKNVAGINFQPVAPWATLAPWLYSVTINPDEYGLTRDQLAVKLRAEGIDTRPFFTPLHRLPPFRRESAERGECLPITDRLSRQGINLPTFTPVETQSVQRVCDVITHLQGA
jgi:perosamine synthetase